MQKPAELNRRASFRELGIPTPFCCLLAARPALAGHVKSWAVVTRTRNDDLPNADLSVPEASGWALPALTVPVGVLDDRAVADLLLNDDLLATNRHATARGGVAIQANATPGAAVAAVDSDALVGHHHAAAKRHGKQNDQRNQLHFMPFLAVEWIVYRVNPNKL